MLLGGWELLVVAVAALLFLGPEKLPEVMRTIARLVAQAQRLVSDAKQSVSDALNEEAHNKQPEDRSVYTNDADKAAFSDWAQEASQQQGHDDQQEQAQTSEAARDKQADGRPPASPHATDAKEKPEDAS